MYIIKNDIPDITMKNCSRYSDIISTLRKPVGVTSCRFVLVASKLSLHSVGFVQIILMILKNVNISFFESIRVHIHIPHLLKTVFQVVASTVSLPSCRK